MALSLFSYDLVLRDDPKHQPLMTGHLYVAGIESAKSYVQTVKVAGLCEASELDVILRDRAGLEIWRGPYLGSTEGFSPAKISVPVT